MFGKIGRLLSQHTSFMHNPSKLLDGRLVLCGNHYICFETRGKPHSEIEILFQYNNHQRINS
jgi:hypothetical protein